MPLEFAALIYRTGLVNNEPRAMAVFWSEVHLHDWYRKTYNKWVEALAWGTGHQTQLRMTGASSTNWVESDPSGLRTDEEFVTTASVNDQIGLSVVQNSVLFDIEPSSMEMDPPFIIASSSFGPMEIVQCSFKLDIQHLDELPDMELFLNHEFSDSGYQLEGTYRIPRNVWFPASAIGKPSNCPAFYHLFDSKHDVANGVIAIPSSVLAVGKDVSLIRLAEYQGKRKIVRIGVARFDGTKKTS